MLYHKFDRVGIGVITENEKDMQLYFNLFRLLLDDRITQVKDSKQDKFIDSEKVYIKFLPKLQGVRGYRFHFVLNLTQDKIYDDTVAKPLTWIFQEMLKNDPDWGKLFEGVK